MNKELLRMQMLAGIITEGQYKQKLLNELQYFHNGTEMNQIINYDDSDITDDLEALGQGSMDGQDFTPGRTYNIGGQEYKIEAQGDEFKLVLTEALNEAVEVPTWLKGKLEDVHVKPGQGSIFSKPIDAVLKLAQDALNKEKNIDKIANSTGTLTVKSPGIGYNLVLPMDQAKKLPGAKEGEVEKIEGPNKVKVPSITTTAPLTQFKSDELTVIVRPKKDESGAVISNEYIVLSAFPGDPSIPRASEWGGKYAVIIPGGKRIEEIVNENKLEMVGSNVDEILDAISLINGGGMKSPFRDTARLKPLDTTGHQIADNKFSIEVELVPSGMTSTKLPNEEEYIQQINSFLKGKEKFKLNYIKSIKR